MIAAENSKSNKITSLSMGGRKLNTIRVKDVEGGPWKKQEAEKVPLLGLSAVLCT